MLGAAAGLAAGGVFARAQAEAKLAISSTDERAQDEAYWLRVRADYDISGEFTNLENGNWGIMSRPVLDAYIVNTERVNRDNSYYARRKFSRDALGIRDRVAASIGASSDELVFTRNATEALTALIVGYRGLVDGDAVMYADLDYGSMRAAMRSLASRHESPVVELSIPEPADHAGLVDFYRKALDDNPKVRLLLLTHISHRTGLMLPVRQIIALARARGVDVILDAAHSWGQLPVNVEELGADFVGFNLHKWIGAPLGVGMMYIRRQRLGTIGLASAAQSAEADLTRGRVHPGTSNFAAVLTVPDALDYHEKIGAENKSARLRYLRSVWVEPVRSLVNVEVLTPDDPRLHVGITSFRLRGQTSGDLNRALVNTLLENYGLFTVARDGVSKGDCVRVTPSLYNTPEDCRMLARALAAISNGFA